MDLIESPPVFDLYDPMWRIYGRNPIEPPHYVAPGSKVRKSIVTEGSVVCGEVEHSVIFAGVKIGRGSYIKDSIIMPDAVIGENTRLNHVIVGEGAIIGNNCDIGFGGMVPNADEPDIYYSGLSVVGEGISIADDVKIGRNCVIQKSINDAALIESGCSVRMEDEQ